MEAIPGSALPGATHTPGPDTKPNTNKPLPPWATRGRWAQRYGVNAKGVTNKPSPFTRKISKAVAQRRAFELALKEAKERNAGLTDDCVRGARLVRGHDRGKLWPYPLKQRKERPAPPTAEQQLKAGVKWKLRGTYVEVLAWLATAQIALRGRSLLATQAQLGELLELSDRRVREVLHELRRWGLVHATPYYVAWGKVTSQRASFYRLTKLAIDTFGLPLDRELAPDMEEGLTPRKSRARQSGSNVPPNPDQYAVLKRSAEQTLCSGGEPSAELAVSTPSTSSACSAPQTATSSCVPTSSTSSTEALRALSAAPTRSHGPVPDAGTSTTHREGSAQSCRPVGRLYEPEGREALPHVADVVPSVRRGDVDERRPVVEKHDDRRRGELEERHRRYHDVAEREREKRDLEERARRQQELVRERLERAEREDLEKRRRLDEVPPPSDHDAPVAVGELADEAARKAELERYKRSLDEFSHVQPPARRRDEHDDFDDVIQNAVKTWESTRFRKRIGPGRRDPRGGES